MLESIREGVQKPWVKIVIFAIVISFVFAGYFTTSFFLGDPNAVAVVNGESITRNDFQRTYLAMKADSQVSTPEQEQRLKENVLQRLITIKVKDQAMNELGLRLSTAALRDKIQNDPNYQVDGKYSSALVDQALIRMQASRESFKLDYENQVLTRQFIAGISSTDFALPSETKTDYALIAQQRSGKAITIGFDKFQDNVALSEEEVAQYYQENIEAFRVEEKVAVDYIELSIDQIQSEQKVSDEEIATFYNENINRYKAEPQKRIAHILVLHNDDESASLQKANEIKARIDAGEAFEELVKTESDDVPTRGSGGDLGVMLAGGVEAEIEEAVNLLENVGDITEPVKTDFGYHIVKVTEIIDGEVQSLEDVKPEILAQLQREKADEAFYALSQDLERLAFEVADSLKEASEKTGLPIKTSPLFGQTSGSGIFSESAIKSAAFSSDVKEAMLNSAPITLGEKHVVVLRLNQHEPSHVQPLEQVRARVERSLKQERAKAAAEALANQLLAKVKAGETVDSLLAENELSWIELDKVQRNNASLPYMANIEFFKMPKPAEGEVTWEVVEGFQGMTLLMLNQVEPGNFESADPQLKAQREEFIASYYANASFSAFIEQRREASDVKRNPDRIP